MSSLHAILHSKQVEFIENLQELPRDHQFFKELEREIKNLPLHGERQFIINPQCHDQISFKITTELSDRGIFTDPLHPSSFRLYSALVEELRNKQILSDTVPMSEEKNLSCIDIKRLNNLARIRFYSFAQENPALNIIDLYEPTVKENDWFRMKYFIQLLSNKNTAGLTAYLSCLLDQKAKEMLSVAAAALKEACKKPSITDLSPTGMPALITRPKQVKKSLPR